MSFVLVDVVCLMLVGFGMTLLLRRPAGGRSHAAEAEQGDARPETYIRRIAGMMLIAFGLAVGVMTTVLHLG